MSKLASRLEEWRAKQADIAQGKVEAPKASRLLLLSCSTLASSPFAAQLQLPKVRERLVRDNQSPAEIQNRQEACQVTSDLWRQGSASTQSRPSTGC